MGNRLVDPSKRPHQIDPYKKQNFIQQQIHRKDPYDNRNHYSFIYARSIEFRVQKPFHEIQPHSIWPLNMVTPYFNTNKIYTLRLFLNNKASFIR